MSELEIHYDPIGGEWAALYVDGKLDVVGDSYHAEERVMELLGVKVVQDDAFMRGQKEASGVARTLDEIREFEQQRRTEEAARFRKEAAEYLERAKALESSGSSTGGTT